jgi:hypothetical protein
MTALRAGNRGSVIGMDKYLLHVFQICFGFLQTSCAMCIMNSFSRDKATAA